VFTRYVAKVIETREIDRSAKGATFLPHRVHQARHTTEEFALSATAVVTGKSPDSIHTVLLLRANGTRLHQPPISKICKICESVTRKSHWRQKRNLLRLSRADSPEWILQGGELGAKGWW
jgi:hypothetical protein